VQICVGNNGPGISPERAPHVFERFYRARGDEQTSGHGLGLSIARELARAHGGELRLTTAQSDWTEFCLRLSASSIHVQTQKPAPVIPLYSEKKGGRLIVPASLIEVKGY
jgi:signal transduction histidine kinase